MKVAIATKNFAEVRGHAGRARQWLVYDLSAHRAGELLPVPTQLELASHEIIHVFEDHQPHPLDGVDLVVAGSAGDGFFRHLKKRGADVVLTSETDPAEVITRILVGEPLPQPGFDITTSLCKLHDLFSKH